MNNSFRISNRELLCDRGEIFFLHNKKAALSSAYILKENAKIRIKIPRTLSVTSAKIEFINSSSEKDIFSVDLKWTSFEYQYDVYQTSKLPITQQKGIYFFNIVFNTILGEIFAVENNRELIFSKDKPHKSFQLTVSDFKYKPPTEQYGGIIYHVFVDRFQRSKNVINKKGTYIIEDWLAPIPEYPKFPGAPLKNNYFYGGDLWGIAEKLDYIKSLGTTILYLSPIFESPSNHKYDTSDYMHVDEMFGGDEALQNLINKANGKGISVMLDGVFNHTGDDSIYFNRYGTYSSIGAYQSPKSRYYPWYNFDSFPDKYSSWWGIEILPKINHDLPDCRNFFVGDGGVIEKYAKFGIGGMRLDVADELSDTFIADIKRKLNEINKDSYLYGEVWEDASNKVAYSKLKSYYLGDELDGVMNYPLRDGLISFLKSGKTEKLKFALTEVTFNAPKRIRDYQMNILGTHDTERIITALGGESQVGKSNEYLSTAKMSCDGYKRARVKLLLGITALFTLPGIPCIFYGDEVGLEGYGDPFNRRTFPWNSMDTVILEHYRTLAKIRKKYKVYSQGSFKLHYLNDGVLIFERADNRSSYITIINNTQNDLSIRLSESSLSLLDMKKSNRFTIKSENSIIVKANINIQFEI